MNDPAPTEKWECKDCKTFRDEPCKFVGPGAPACSRCCQPMTRVPVLVDGGVLRDALDLDRAIGRLPSATDAMVHDFLARDPDEVMEPQGDGHE